MDLQPLSSQFAITDERGKPTLYFTQWAQQRLTDTNDALAGYAPLAGATFTGPVSIIDPTGLTLKASATSSGFSIFDRASVPGHQCVFASNAPVTNAGAVIDVYATLSTTTNRNISEIALWTVAPTQPSAVHCDILATHGTSGEELWLRTVLQGAAGEVPGDIVVRPGNVEKLRVVALAGAPTQVKVTGQLSVTDEAYGASWSGSLNVPTKNAVYNKIQTISGGGGSTPTIRGSAAGVYNAASVTITFPVGTVVGDVVVVYWENGFVISAPPAGWTPVWIPNNSSNFTSQACAAKIMTAGDIATGSVTVTVSGGSFNGFWGIVTLTGTTVSTFDRTEHFDSSGSTSIPLAVVSAMLGITSTDLIFGFCSTRSNQSLTVSAGLTILQTAAGASASGIVFIATALGKLGLNETITAAVANNGLAWNTLAFKGP